MCSILSAPDRDGNVSSCLKFLPWHFFTDGLWPEIRPKINLFSPKLLFVGVFYHSNRNETRADECKIWTQKCMVVGVAQFFKNLKCSLCCWAASLQRLVETIFKWKAERDLTVKRKVLRHDVTSVYHSECWVSLVTRGEGECFQGWVTDHSTEPLLCFQVETMQWPEVFIFMYSSFFLLSSIECVNSSALPLHRLF